MNKRHARGFTLIELIIFIVVISVGLTGIMLVVDTVVASSADPLVRKQSVSIAESMLAEILLKDYANPEEGYTGTIRSLFDDIGDYAGYSTSAGIADQSGLVRLGTRVRCEAGQRTAHKHERGSEPKHEFYTAFLRLHGCLSFTCVHASTHSMLTSRCPPVRCRRAHRLSISTPFGT